MLKIMRPTEEGDDVPPGNVSIVIPCFNAVATLLDSIHSALAQANVEVIVVDDGSSDNSLGIARRLEPEVRVLTGPNRGVSAARNRGISESSGEWIVFLDSDDVLLPGTVAKRVEAARASGADVIVCDWEEESGDESSTTDSSVRRPDMAALSVDPEVACATRFYVRLAALMYRRSLVERIAGFREDLALIEDARFLFDAARQRASFGYSPHIGARIGARPSSLSRSDPGRFWQYVLINGRQIEALWRARGALSSTEVEALFGIFDSAARGLFVATRVEYFEAVECQRKLGKKLTRHSRFVPHLARAFGLPCAQRVLGVIGR
jgi:glycosyltransferase involved in cell wall biosynthesis